MDELTVCSLLQVSQREHFKLSGQRFRDFGVSDSRILGGLAFDECLCEISLRVFMENMKILIFIPIEPARVESTSRMKVMRKQMRPRRPHRNVGFHHTLAGSSRTDFFDG